MTNSLSYLIGIILTIVIGTFLYFTLCSDCRLTSVQPEITDQEIKPGETPEPTSFPFAIQHSDLTLKTEDNFNFDIASGAFKIPVSFEVNKRIERLKTYLLENSDKAVTITGLYLPSEKNSTAWPNLGLARANSVKNYLVGSGIPSVQTNTTGKSNKELVPRANTLLGPVEYLLVDRVENEESLKALYEKITKDPLVLYFETGEATLILSPEQRKKVADIARYLDKVEGAGCSVVGHTDNTGQRASNIALAQNRADFVKAFLIRNGIPETKVVSSSKGSDAPLASNETEEGRSKNRRTVVTLN